MGTPDISQELSTSLRLISPGPVIAGNAGDAFDLTTYAGLITSASQTTTLSRKPTGSAASVASHTFTTDLPGEYDVSVAAVGVTKSYRIAVFPAAFLTTRYNADPSGQSTPAKFFTRNQLAAWAAACTTAQVSAAIEGTALGGGGTASVTNNSASVTFSASQTLLPGTVIQFSSQPGVQYTILNGFTGTTGTLSTNYTGTTNGAAVAVTGGTIAGLWATGNANATAALQNT